MKFSIIKLQRFSFLLLVVGGVFSSDLPKENLLPFIVSLGAFFFLFLLWFIKGDFKVTKAQLLMVLFLLFLVVSAFNSNLYDVSFRDWALRGAFPFIFLSAFLFVPNDSKEDFQFIKILMVFSFILWSLKILFDLFFSEGSVLVRWTTISRDLLFPYNLMLMPFLVFNKNYFGRYYYVLVMLAVAMTLGAGYRMQFILLAAMLLYFLYREAISRKYKKLILASVVLSLSLGYALSTEVGDLFVERISSIKSEGSSSRVEEIKYALSHFVDSPLIGKGPAYPIPLEVTFFGRENYVRGVAQAYGGDYTHVTYMHNIVMYSLMNFGILGSLLFFGFFTSILFSNMNAHLKGEVRQAKVALVLVLAFNLTAATFTLFQYHLILVMLTLLITNKYIKTGRCNA